jgi:hypothetical protein
MRSPEAAARPPVATPLPAGHEDALHAAVRGPGSASLAFTGRPATDGAPPYTQGRDHRNRRMLSRLLIMR